MVIILGTVYHYESDGEKMVLVKTSFEGFCDVCEERTRHDAAPGIIYTSTKTNMYYKCQKCGHISMKEKGKKPPVISIEAEPEEIDEVEDLFAKLKEDLDD